MLEETTKTVLERTTRTLLSKAAQLERKATSTWMPTLLPTDEDGVNDLAYKCHHLSAAAGWWNDVGAVPDAYIVPTKISLIHSEISEALEGYRKDSQDDHLPHRPSIEVELADAIIRICDLAGYLDLDLGGAVIEKVGYNQQREDHKPENRSKEGGKKF